MDKTYQPQKSVIQLGFWSAVVVTLMLIVFPLSLIFGSLDMAYGSSLLLAPAFVTMMVSIHHYAAPDKKVWSQLGLSFAVIYAVMCSLTYYVQLTFIKNNYLPIADEALAPFVFAPGTPFFAQDMLGYVFFCIATLAAGPVFTGGRLETWIKWLFILNGVLFAIPTAILPVLTMPTNAAGTGLGNQVAVYANVMWSMFVAISTALVAVLFKRAYRAGWADMNTKISIRKETPEDITAIRQVNEKAFGRAGEADIVDSLRRRGVVTLSLVAEQDEQIVGHILFSPVTIKSETSSFEAIALGPMAVLPSHQRLGIGSQLVRAGLEECKKMGQLIVIVLGHPEFYPRFGFKPSRPFGISWEKKVPDEVFMLVELTEGTLHGRGGIVIYQDEFRG